LKSPNSNALLDLPGSSLPEWNVRGNVSNGTPDKLQSSARLNERIPRWTPLRSIKEPNRIRKLTFYLRCFQFGLLFGIFVDAFKVGS